MKKSVKIIFTLSIILNLLLLGIIGGHAYRIKNKPRAWDEVKQSLAPETNKVFKEAFKGKGKDIWRFSKDVKQRKQALKEVIVAEEFDSVAFDAAARDLLTLKEAFSDRKVKFMEGVLSQLPQEERVKLADHMVEKLFGKSLRKKGGKHKHGEDVSPARDGAQEPSPESSED